MATAQQDLQRGWALHQQRRCAEAESIYRRVLNTAQDNAAAWCYLGIALHDQRHYEQAVAAYRKALELQPDDFAILDSMGWVLFKLGKHAEALTYLRRSWDAGQDTEVAAHLGEVLWATGDQAGAREIWQRALKKNPDHKMLRGVIQRFGVKL